MTTDTSIPEAENAFDFFDSLTHPTVSGRWLNTHFDASVERLLDNMNSVGVTRSCLVGIEGVMDNADVHSLTRRYPDRFVPIAGFNPARYDSIAEVDSGLKSVAEQRFAGIKLHPRFNNYDPLHPHCLRAIQMAGRHGLVAFVCTLFRQKDRVTAPTADIVDTIAKRCPDTQVVLLHGGASAMLDIFELVRMHKHLTLDLAFTLLRYEGSSLDLDMRFVCRTLDERLVYGSDFPEYLPSEAKTRIITLTRGLPSEKRQRICGGNLKRLLGNWHGL